jgi:hypothetical protein
LNPGFYDMALRDIDLSLSVPARLGQEFNPGPVGV